MRSSAGVPGPGPWEMGDNSRHLDVRQVTFVNLRTLCVTIVDTTWNSLGPDRAPDKSKLCQLEQVSAVRTATVHLSRKQH